MADNIASTPPRGYRPNNPRLDDEVPEVQSGPSHTARVGEDQDKDRRTRIEKTTKSCPRCSKNIDRNEEYNHITCLTCDYKFCSKCRDKWSESHRKDCMYRLQDSLPPTTNIELQVSSAVLLADNSLKGTEPRHYITGSGVDPGQISGSNTRQTTTQNAGQLPGQKTKTPRGKYTNAEAIAMALSQNGPMSIPHIVSWLSRSAVRDKLSQNWEKNISAVLNQYDWFAKACSDSHSKQATYLLTEKGKREVKNLDPQDFEVESNNSTSNSPPKLMDLEWRKFAITASAATNASDNGRPVGSAPALQTRDGRRSVMVDTGTPVGTSPVERLEANSEGRIATYQNKTTSKEPPRLGSTGGSAPQGNKIDDLNGFSVVEETERNSSRDEDVCNGRANKDVQMTGLQYNGLDTNRIEATDDGASQIRTPRSRVNQQSPTIQSSYEIPKTGLPRSHSESEANAGQKRKRNDSEQTRDVRDHEARSGTRSTLSKLAEVMREADSGIKRIMKEHILEICAESDNLPATGLQAKLHKYIAQVGEDLRN